MMWKMIDEGLNTKQKSKADREVEARPILNLSKTENYVQFHKKGYSEE